MKNQWLAYAIVVLISALAGVAIAGSPNSSGTDVTLVVPDSVAPTTTPALVETVAPETTLVDAPEATDSDAVTTTTSTAQATTTTTEADPVIAPADLVVVSINGAGRAGLATRVRNELRDAGYTSTRATDGTTFVDTTVVYFYPFREREAADVAETLGLDPGDIKPVVEAPQFGQIEGDHVAVYLGRDRA